MYVGVAAYLAEKTLADGPNSRRFSPSNISRCTVSRTLNIAGSYDVVTYIP